jgi:hypothetical protein
MGLPRRLAQLGTQPVESMNPKCPNWAAEMAALEDFEEGVAA